jgi:hypothetical protein
MVIFGRVLTGISTIAIIFLLVFAVACNWDQSSRSSASSGSQSSPAAVTQSTSPTDTTTTTSTTTTSTQTPTTKAGPENYGQVKIGMTSKQVTDLMGNASKVKQEGQSTEWEYYLPQGGKFELHLQNDKVISTSRH